jgi:hypothetical protein
MGIASLHPSYALDPATQMSDVLPYRTMAYNNA